jgi:hypothetical protein
MDFDWTDIVSGVWDWAKENPALAGAAAGVITGGGTGNYGSSNFQNALGGAAVGQIGSHFLGGDSTRAQSPATAEAGTNPNAGLQMAQRPTSTAPAMPGVEGSPIASGAAGNFGNYGNEGRNYAVDTSNYSNEGRNYAAPVTATAPATTGFAGLMGQAKSGMGTLKQFGKDFKEPIELGTKLYAGLKSQQAGDAYQQYLNQQGQQNSEINSRNTALTTEKVGMGREMADNARANAAGAGVKAYAQGIAGAGRVAQKQTTQGNKQRALIQGAGNAGTAYATADQGARAGLAPAMSTAAGLMGPYATPSNKAGDYAAAQKYYSDSQTSPYATVANDIFGLSNPKADEETDINRVKAG